MRRGSQEQKGEEGKARRFGHACGPPAFQWLHGTARLVQVTRGASPWHASGPCLPDIGEVVTGPERGLLRAPPRPQVHLVNNGGRLRGQDSEARAVSSTRRRSRGAHISPHQPLSSTHRVPGGRGGTVILTTLHSATMFRVAPVRPLLSSWTHVAMIRFPKWERNQSLPLTTPPTLASDLPPGARL